MNDGPLSDSAIDDVVQAYLQAEGDALAALRAAVRDAIADLTDRELRLAAAERLVSRGYVRGRLGHDG
ncbi:hypothetical protein ACFQU1_20620 [Chelatococcus sp. GCM10030263]|uniref:hypothetical protein n=1 Tax=Chelatococcus sp. GCM10030263 TaxID=3273387 RepID=UPI00361B25B7